MLISDASSFFIRVLVVLILTRNNKKDPREGESFL